MIAVRWYRRIGLHNRLPLLASLLCFLLLCALLGAYGVREGGDTGRFLAAAEQIRAGEPFQGKQGSYFGYAFVVFSLFLWAGLPPLVLVLLQILLACSSVYIWVRELGPVVGNLAVFWGTVFLLFYPDWLAWNIYLLTDGPFISLTLLTFAGVMRWWKKGDWWAVLLTLGSSWLAATLRPHGLVLWFFVLAIATLILVVQHRRWLLRKVSFLLVVGVAGTLVLVSFSAGSQAERPLVHLLAGEILWRDQKWVVVMPSPDESLPVHWKGYVLYSWRHPAEVLSLWMSRLGATLMPFRPDYSSLHQVAIGLSLFFVYTFAMVGLTAVPRSFFWVLAYLPFILAPAVLFFADRDGRWLLYGLPLLSPLVGWGILRMFMGIRCLGNRRLIRPTP